jgi:hypothetical protein
MGEWLALHRATATVHNWMAYKRTDVHFTLLLYGERLLSRTDTSPDIDGGRGVVVGTCSLREIHRTWWPDNLLWRKMSGR